jgi:CHAT domain-containing protein
MRGTTGPDLRPLVAAALVTVACVGCRSAHLLDETSVAFRGHRELDGGVPLAIGRETPLGICLEAEETRDTSRWVGRFPPAAVFGPPQVRLGSTLCFENEGTADLDDGAHELCLEVQDEFDGAKDRACLPFRFRAEAPELAKLEGRLKEILGHGAPIADLDALARGAGEQGFPFLEIRVRLISVYFLRRSGTDAGRAEAARRLAVAPPWLGSPAAKSWAAQLAYERATLALDAGELERSWSELRSAEGAFRAIADSKWIVAVSKQAEILSRVGALAEAQRKLGLTLAQCGDSKCDEHLMRAAETTFSWLVLIDPDADPSALERAEATLGRALDGMGDAADKKERANVLVNLAYLHERQGQDPTAELARARALVTEPSELASWSRLVEGLHATRAGDAARGLAACDGVLDRGGSARLRAWAASCAAGALRGRGDLVRAADRLALAQLLGEESGAARFDQVIPIGPGQRAETAYRAARVAIERDRAAEAWATLAALDRTLGDEEPRSSPERETLLAELRALEEPATPARREQRESIRRSTLERLQELARSGSSSPARADATSDLGVSFRAFALEDEVLLLYRPLGGGPRLYRRTALPRAELLSAIGALATAMEAREPTEARWRAAAATLAAALVPDERDLGPVTTFALSGVLQSVPLDALPVPSGSGWLGEATTVAYRPSGAGRRVAQVREGSWLFVVDPRRSLGTRSLARFYRSAPKAEVLEGGKATAAALERELAGARSLHLDTHAHYDPAFPELSTLELADRMLTAAELAAWSGGLELANLSACHSGSWPVTADSGRFGLAGALARAGVRWVVASRAELDDALAVDFNRAFYERLTQGSSVPDAYRRALAKVRPSHPVASWAGLLLLESGPDSGGQSAAGRTP